MLQQNPPKVPKNSDIFLNKILDFNCLIYAQKGPSLFYYIIHYYPAKYKFGIVKTFSKHKREKL